METKTLENVKRLIDTKEKEIFETANRHFKDITPEGYGLAPVHYMGSGTPGDTQGGIWEVGIVPKKVDFDPATCRVSAQVLLCNAHEDDTFSRVSCDECILCNKVWERYPD